jgi:hypothetical protein
LLAVPQGTRCRNIHSLRCFHEKECGVMSVLLFLVPKIHFCP